MSFGRQDLKRQQNFGGEAVELGNTIEKQCMLSFAVEQLLASLLIVTFDFFFRACSKDFCFVYNKISRP